MALVVMMTVAGASLGVLFASVTVPTYRRLPAISAQLLAILATLTLIWIDASNFTAASLFVAASVLTSTGYAAARWKTLLPELSPSRVWFWRAAFSHPRYLRDSYQAKMQAAAAASSAPEL